MAVLLDEDGARKLRNVYPTLTGLEPASHSQDRGEEPAPIAPDLEPPGPPPPRLSLEEATDRLCALTGYPRSTFLLSTPDRLALIFHQWHIAPDDPAANVLLDYSLSRKQLNDPRQRRPL